MSVRRILFVDDEPLVLGALQNILRRQRHEWDMKFVLGGAAAKAELERAAFDVIVTDMKMPELDGPTLLAIAKEKYPGMARIVLSGQAEHDAVMRALPFAHQYIAKPCDVNILHGVIERTCQLQQLFMSEAMRTIVGRLDALPSPEHNFLALNDALRNPNAGIASVAEVIESDPAMVAKVLQLVNSAYFGLRRSVTSVAQAVRLLGIELLTGLLLTARVFSLYDRKAANGFPVERLHDHSLRAAQASRLILHDDEAQEEAFTAALLHDVGQLVLAVGVPDRYEKLTAEAQKANEPLFVLEQSEFGVSHAEVGAYLLGVWGLPFSMVEAVAYHHRPSAVTAGNRDILAVLHTVDVLVDLEQGYDADEVPGLDMEFLASGPWFAELPRWRALIRDGLPRLGSTTGDATANDA